MSRAVLTFASAAIVGSVFLRRYPFPDGDFLMQLTLHSKPWVYHWLRWSWTAMLFTTPAIAFSAVFSLIYIFTAGREQPIPGKLPPYPGPGAGEGLRLVLGEMHHPRKATPVEHPTWLSIPARGLYTGIAVFGAIGSGKTSAALRPFASQLLSWRADDPEQKLGGIVLEVKGDFCHQARSILKQSGRDSDYVELGLDTEYRYNPLHNDLDSFSLAYSIATLLNQLYGRGKEPFWQQAYTNLVKFLILLHKVVDGYATLFDVYACAIDSDRLKQKIHEGETLFAGIASPQAFIVIDPMLYLAHDALAQITWESLPEGMRAPYTDELAALLDGLAAPYHVDAQDTGDPDHLAMRLAQFEAVKRWHHHDWSRIDTKLRTSIVEGISVFLSAFDSDPKLKRIFCPPKECYNAQVNADLRYGQPLPAFAELIESGRVLALNFPVSANPATARVVAILMKQDYQRAMLGRIPLMAEQPERHFRPSLMLIDEYHALATVGEADPSGDEKFTALSRQAKCIPIIATQSISSLRSTLPGEAWRTLLQSFRTKLFLTLTDDFSCKVASDLCGSAEQLVPSYSLSETGNDVRVSTLTGRALAHKAGMSINKTFTMQLRPIFEPRIFSSLPNAQAVALAFDGSNPLPPVIVMLKPHFLPVQQSWFEQREKGLI